MKPDHEGAQSASAGLYEKDFYAWAQEQATGLRAARDLMRPGRNEPLENLDWENLAAEIEGNASDAVRLAARSLIEHGGIDATAASRRVANYRLEQVVNDWWPEPLTPPPNGGRRSTRGRARRQA